MKRHSQKDIIEVAPLKIDEVHLIVEVAPLKIDEVHLLLYIIIKPLYITKILHITNETITKGHYFNIYPKKGNRREKFRKTKFS